MKTTNFKVGQKVVCVDDHFSITYFPSIKAGNIYTISAINICACGNVRLDVGIKNFSAGVFCTICSCSMRSDIRVFKAIRFRPLSYSSISETLASTCLNQTIETSDCPILTDPTPKPNLIPEKV